DASVNSLALKESGLDKNSSVTDGGTGYLEKDPKTGELTGILRSCTRLVKTRSNAKPASNADELTRLKTLLADYNKVGLTSITDKDASDGEIALFRQLREANQLTCRVYLHASVDAQAPLEKIAERFQTLAKHPLRQYDNWLWLRGVKSYLDGGMLTGSAYMRQPWGLSKIYSINDPDYRGLLYIPAEKLRDITRLAVRHDLQMTAHSVGDGAVHALIDAYQEINRELVTEQSPNGLPTKPLARRDGDPPTRTSSNAPIARSRPSVTHCNFMSREAIETMRELGIVCDLQPAWLWLDGQTLRNQFGNDRLAYFQPYRSLFERGVIVGGGSDHMQKIGGIRSVNPYNPFLGMWITLARSPKRSTEPLHSEQKLTREQAIRLYTINNAWLTFEENEKGSLEAGKLADFIVLKTDILSCDEEAIRDIEVSRTYVGGRLVYESR
ncbi:MAG: amidohydrolase family protein, partial [Planctomycetota bacterium]|nr:amidohydrolase family protein [Planctomycetota bacterium]